MATDAEKEQITKEIVDLFRGLDLDEVATLLVVQLTMLVTQDAESREDAILFLDQIRDQSRGIIETLPIGQADGGNGGDAAG